MDELSSHDDMLAKIYVIEQMLQFSMAIQFAAHPEDLSRDLRDGIASIMKKMRPDQSSDFLDDRRAAAVNRRISELTDSFLTDLARREAEIRASSYREANIRP